MIDELKPYPEYKDSGVEWLGEVPAHWEVLPALAAFRPKCVKNIGMRETTVLSLSYGRIVIKPKEKLHGLVPESFETYQVIEPGDIIIRATDLQNDQKSLRVGRAVDHGIITSAYMCLRTSPAVEDRFGYQLLNAYDRLKILYGFGSGLRQNLDFDHMKRMPVLVPPLPEQTAIVRFLDYVDRRVRRVIRARQRLVKLLEEYKQALIHQAVTGQIDVRTGKPYPAYKDSGVERLGEVPAHWEVRRLRNVVDMRVSNVDKHSKDGEQPVRLCNYVDVYKHERIRADMPFMRATATADEIERFRLEEHDVLITKDSEAWDDIGVPALVESSAPDLISGYHLALLRAKQEIIQGAYLLRAMQSRPVSYQLHVEAKGVTRYGLSHHAIKSCLVSVPPLPEQTAIVRFLDEQTAKLDRAAAAARREIELLEEFRTRLIADVVTGKLDVREVAARLPEEPEEPEPLDELEADAETEEAADDLDDSPEEAEA